MPQAEAVDRAKQALDLADPFAKAYKSPSHLSAGEKKRAAAIAGILATDAKLLALDEPDQPSWIHPVSARLANCSPVCRTLEDIGDLSGYGICAID